MRRGDNILVLCEVFNADESIHASNYREKLRGLEEKHQNHECWFGIEQEYPFMDTDE